jgi:hypothetical protein
VAAGSQSAIGCDADRVRLPLNRTRKLREDSDTIVAITLTSTISTSSILARAPRVTLVHPLTPLLLISRNHRPCS